MDPHAARIVELKRILSSEADLEVVTEYFFDHLADNRDFMRACQSAEHPILRAMVLKLAKEVTPLADEAQSMTMFLRYKQVPFYHGSVLTGGCMGSVLYFDNIGKGLLGLTGPGDGKMHYLRFSTAEPPGSANAGRN